MMNENICIQQGWQCPICHRIYSPITPMCYYCGDATKNSTTTGTIKTIALSAEPYIEKIYIGKPIHPQEQIDRNNYYKKYDIIYKNNIILSLKRKNSKQVSDFLKDILDGKTECKYIKEIIKDIKDCTIRHTKITYDKIPA